nr:ATP synthase F0 subunit 8 [Eusirus cf. giganteus clade g1]
MPQMAPILWAPLFCLVLTLLAVLMSSLYFTLFSADLKSSSSPAEGRHLPWLW